MKKLFFILILFISAAASSQDVIGKRLIGTQSIILQGYRVDTLYNDTLFLNRTKTLPTADAIYRFVKGRVDYAFANISNGVTSIGALDGGIEDNKGANIAAGVLYMQSSDGTFPGLLSVSQHKRLFTLQTSGDPIGTITHNENLGGQHKIILTTAGGRTLGFSNLTTGDITLFNFENNTGGSVTLTLPSNSFVNFAAAGSATIPEGKSALSLWQFDGTNYYFVQNYETVAGAAGQIAFFSSANTITGDNGFFWDDVNKIVGIGTVAPSSKAILELSSVNKGFLPPRLTASQRTGITSPNTALFVYDTDSSRYFGYIGSEWKGIRWTSDAAGGGGGTPGGSAGQIQFNDGGAFGGTAGFTYQVGASPNVTIQAQNAAYIALTVKAAASQSTNIQEWQNSAGTVLTRITKDGYIITPDGTSTAPALNVGTTIGFYNYSGVAAGFYNTSIGAHMIFGHHILSFKTASSVRISFGNGGDWGTTENIRLSTPAVGSLKLLYDNTGTNGNAIGNTILLGSAATGTGNGGDFGWQTSVKNTTGTTVQVFGDRYRALGKYTDLTEATATAFARINVPSGTVTGGEIIVTIEANDATDFQARTLVFIWAAVNKAGTTTITISTTPEEVVAVSAGTLTATISAVDSGSGNVDFRADVTSSLTQTTLRANAQVSKNFGTGAISSQ